MAIDRAPIPDGQANAAFDATAARQNWLSSQQPFEETMEQRVARAMAVPVQPVENFSPHQQSLVASGFLNIGIQPDRDSVEIKLPDGTVEKHAAEPVFVNGHTLMIPRDLTATSRTFSRIFERA